MCYYVRMKTPENAFEFPATTEHPDNAYFDTNVISWNFSHEGNDATLGFIQPGFKDVFPVSNGGEHITLTHHQQGELQIDELDQNGEVRISHSLKEDGDAVFIPGGQKMRVSTLGNIIEYVCVYPGTDTET